MCFITSSKVRVTSNSKQTLGRRGNRLSIPLPTIPTCCSLCARPASQLGGSKDQNSPQRSSIPLLFSSSSPNNIEPAISERRQRPCHALLLRRSKKQQGGKKKKKRVGAPRRHRSALLAASGALSSSQWTVRVWTCVRVCTACRDWHSWSPPDTGRGVRGYGGRGVEGGVWQWSSHSQRNIPFRLETGVCDSACVCACVCGGHVQLWSAIPLKIHLEGV